MQEDPIDLVPEPVLVEVDELSKRLGTQVTITLVDDGSVGLIIPGVIDMMLFSEMEQLHRNLVVLNMISLRTMVHGTRVEKSVLGGGARPPLSTSDTRKALAAMHVYTK